MTKPTGRILPDLTSLNEGGWSPSGETPEEIARKSGSKLALLSKQQWRENYRAMIDYENQLADEETAQRDFRKRNGIPPNIEPRSTHSKVPDPPWKRKLRP